MVVNYGSLALLLGTVVYGIVDGFIYHYQHRQRLERLLRAAVVVLPGAAPGGGGLSLICRF